MEEEIEPYVDRIMELIKGALPRSEMTLKKRATIDPSVFKCITFLALALESHEKMDIPNILEQMLATGLSSSLTICLRELAKSVPIHKVCHLYLGHHIYIQVSLIDNIIK